MNRQTGLICAYLLDGEGGGQWISAAGLARMKPSGGTLWLHLDRTASDARDWLNRAGGFDPAVVEALLASETRPRCVGVGDGLLLALRGVNLNPDSDPEDMVALRIWVNRRGMVSVRGRHLMAVDDLRARIEAGDGPRDSGSMIAMLARRLMRRMEPVIAGLNGRVDALEDITPDADRRKAKAELADVRTEAILLHRYLAPQREALRTAQFAEVDWLSPAHRLELSECVDMTERYVEDLEALRERATVVHDELVALDSERMSRTMYLLSIVAAIFLPLGFITGLLGVNVGGIPGVGNPWGFAIVSAGVFAIAIAEYVIFRHLKWL